MKARWAVYFEWLYQAPGESVSESVSSVVIYTVSTSGDIHEAMADSWVCFVAKQLVEHSPSGWLDLKHSSKHANKTECSMAAAKVSGAVVLFKQMLSGPSFSVLPDPFVTSKLLFIISTFEVNFVGGSNN